MKTMAFLGFSAFVALATLTSSVRADDKHYDVAPGKGQVVLTVRDGWHINKDYHWSVKNSSGDKIKKAEDFKLDEKTAKVENVPAGSYTLVGAVCSESSCAPFTESVTVQ
jgi:hypothetical protein